MRILRKFLKLTSRTYPHGTETMLEAHLPRGTSRDPYGNYYLVVGETTTMFACHLDTACKNPEPVRHVVSNGLVSSDGTTVLGADDKAGMVVMLYMIGKGVPGVYYFFVGE